MTERSEGPAGGSFFSRWSQRKQDERAGKPLDEPPTLQVRNAPIKPLAPTSEASAAPVLGQPVAAGAATTPEPQAPPLPTLADVQGLTPQSDFKPFMARGVTAEVKNAAMKKLFADPHFNVMDRLDTYIDDYSLPDPMPLAMVRQLAGAKFLNLFEAEEKAEALAANNLQNSLVTRDDTDGGGMQSMAQSEANSTPLTEPSQKISPPHDHLDLRLQPDHAPEPQSLGRGAA